MVSAPVVSLPASSAAEIYGPLLVGAFLSTLFFGVTLVQFFNYYESSRQDPKWMKILVSYLFLAAAAGAVFDAMIVYQPLVLEFGRLSDTVPLFLRADGALTVAVSTPIQIFMAWRIMILNESRWAGVVIAILSVVSGVGGIWTTISLSLNPRFSLIPLIRAPPTIWLLTTAIADILITVSLAYSLSKKKTGYAQMDSYVSHIMRLTIQTGAFTAVAAVADVTVFLVLQHTTIFFIWDLSLSKFYVASMLSSLNARNTFKESRNALFSSQKNEATSFASAGITSTHLGRSRLSMELSQHAVHLDPRQTDYNRDYTGYDRKPTDLEAGSVGTYRSYSNTRVVQQTRTDNRI